MLFQQPASSCRDDLDSSEASRSAALCESTQADTQPECELQDRAAPHECCSNALHEEDTCPEAQVTTMDRRRHRTWRAVRCVCLRQQCRDTQVRQAILVDFYGRAIYTELHSSHRWLVVPLIHTFTKDDPEASHKFAIKVLASGLSPVDTQADQDVLAFDVRLS